MRQRFRVLGGSLLVIVLLVGGGAATAQQVEGTDTENPVVVYEGVEIEVEPEKGPVQGIVVRRTVIEDLDSTTVMVDAVVIVHTTSGWNIAAVMTDDRTGETTGDELEDGFHIEWES